AAAARELAEWIGRAPEDPPALEPPDSLRDAPPSAADSARVLAAATARPSVRRAEVELQQAGVDVEEARRRNGLQVGLSADAGLWGSDVTHAIPPDVALEHPNATLADRLRRDLGASVSVDVRRPVLDPSLAHGVAAREAARETAALKLEAERARSRRDALDLLGRWRAGAERVAREQANVARAGQHLLRMRALYAGGDAPLLDVLDVGRQVEDAREKLADARFELRLARVVAEELP
ncbi:MAG TPA: TolC family protein, partial [Candidatus Eisenbacteria bacterium]|nr:TolC family protein [Candidatus Eisenbacteria bacterium]